MVDKEIWGQEIELGLRFFECILIRINPFSTNVGLM